MKYPLAGLAALACVLLSFDARSEQVVHARMDRATEFYEVNRDLTYTRTGTEDITLFTDRALRHHDRVSGTFYPDKQSLEVVEAWVDQPDGTRIPVEKSSIFTKPSAASRSAPGFVNSMTTTVLFPRLVPGSHTHVVWRFVQKTPPLLGFNTYNMNLFEWDTALDETRIDIPADVPLHWRARGGYRVSDTTENGVRHVDALIENTRGREEEPAMTDQMDFMPLFLATTLANTETLGAIVDKASEGKAAATPEIAALAAKIAGDRTGLDAARAIHAWVAANIRYVAVYLDPDDGWVPHEAAEILKAGYGDCKDYVTLMRALLAARGIDGRMAVIDWGDRYKDLPLWMPYFNHAILYLPEYDRYLNPTDFDAPFDALDRRLSGKPTAIVTPEGRAGRTPEATREANRYRYTADATLRADGTIDGVAHYAMSPNMEIQARSWLRAVSSTNDMARRLLAYTPEGGFGAFEASDPRDLAKPLTMTGTWHSPRATNARDTETYLRVPVGLDIYSPARRRDKLSPHGERRTPLIADVTDSGWEIAIALPPGTDVARLPPDVDTETKMGRYTARYEVANGKIVAKRSLTVDRQVVEPEDDAEFERLIYASLVDLRATIVLRQDFPAALR